jgi:hypothetical protein
MTSELRVDKIHNEGGDNDSGIDLSTNDQIVLKTANTTRLTMNATGQTTIVGEGGSTTTNLQQGLCKAWVDGTDAAVLTDSFNLASGTDNGTGDYTYAITNDMASVNYCVPTGALYAALQGTFAQATDSYRIKCFGRADSLTAENTTHFVTIFGDLA